jgi:signal peptidase II
MFSRDAEDEMRRHAPYALLVAAIILLDQVTKALLVRAVPFYSSVRIIPGFANLTHIHNKGAILGFFNQSESPWTPIILLGLNLAALALVFWYYSKTAVEERGLRTALAFIVGGALGNVIDRIVRGYVVDFIELYVGKFHWPTFNVADSCISIGAVLLLLTVIFRRPYASDPV